VREYRRQGFPFVQVSTPSRRSRRRFADRVVEFRVGKVE